VNKGLWRKQEASALFKTPVCTQNRNPGVASPASGADHSKHMGIGPGEDIRRQTEFLRPDRVGAQIIQMTAGDATVGSTPARCGFHSSESSGRIAVAWHQAVPFSRASRYSAFLVASPDPWPGEFALSRRRHGSSKWVGPVSLRFQSCPLVLGTASGLYPRLADCGASA